MLLFLETVDIIAVLLMLFILAVILKQPSSRAKTAFILYNVFSIFFVAGIHLELLHSDTIGEALAGLCVQYIGQSGILLSLLWFVSEFARFPVPVWVYILDAVCYAFVITGIFTAESHHFFYTSMKILTNGMYNRIEVGHGVLWYLHYIILDSVVFIILALCAVRYKKSTPVQKKRILYIAAGTSVLAASLALKRAGLFGSYNPIVASMTLCMFCMMMAMVRYSYFGSLHAAVDNAFNHGNEGLVILDSDGTIIFANYRMDELLPDIHKGGKISNYPEITEVMESGNLFNKDGTLYEVRIEDITEHGERNGYILWFVDQTQTLLTMQKLKEADEAKTQFLMRASHELRTPVNTMLGMNEMVIRESSEEKIRNYAKEAAQAGAHMILLLDEILNASRLESGEREIIKKPYRISRVLSKVEGLMRPQAEQKGLLFISKAEKILMDENMFQNGDSSNLVIVLSNLLSNAIKYTDKGFVSIEANTQAGVAGRLVIFSVSDSGIGIQEDELEYIFENFGRGSNTGGRDGMGLGLAIVKKIVKAMGGKLTVESTQGKGSRFDVSLEWEEASEEEVAAWKKEHENEEAAGNTEKREWPDFHTKTILTVDDNSRNIMVLKHLLKRTKATIETASDGNEAVRACIRKKYDLVLLDHMMPGMDGITAFHEIKERKDSKNHDTKVIALTANAGKVAEQMYLSEGFAGYLSKPVDPDKLEQLLLYCLSENGRAGPVETGESEEEILPEDIGINVQEGLRYADMDTVFYHKMLNLFARQYKEQQQKLERIYHDIQAETENDVLWNKWTILCHRLKGEAKGIGAQVLGIYFYNLELAGSIKDKERIKEIYPPASGEWQKIVDSIPQIADSISQQDTGAPPFS